MTQIKSYKHTPVGIEHDNASQSTENKWSSECAERGGFNPVTKVLTPMRYGSGAMAMHEALDAITAAAEAGIIDDDDWVTQLFSNDAELEAFFEELEQYDDCYRINDRWWRALAELAGSANFEEGFVSCREIVDGLRESIAEGIERKNLFVLETEYKAANPVTPLQLTEKQSIDLESYNAKVNELAGSKRKSPVLSYDETRRFTFVNRVAALDGKLLSYREATAADIAAFSNKGAAKSVPLTKPKVKTPKATART